MISIDCMKIMNKRKVKNHIYGEFTLIINVLLFFESLRLRWNINSISIRVNLMGHWSPRRSLVTYPFFSSSRRKNQILFTIKYRRSVVHNSRKHARSIKDEGARTRRKLHEQRAYINATRRVAPTKGSPRKKLRWAARVLVVSRIQWIF